LSASLRKMTDETNQPTPEEIEAQREGRRAIHLLNLGNDVLGSMTAAYVTHKTAGYGAITEGAVHDEIYLPAFREGINAVNPETGEEYNVIANALLGSRDGQDDLYGGSTTEKGIMKSCLAIVNRSVRGVKANDLLQAVGSERATADDNNPWIADLDDTQTENAMTMYQTYLVNDRVATAHTGLAAQGRLGLEAMFAPEESTDASE
jgi:hypothetical protein